MDQRTFSLSLISSQKNLAHHNENSCQLVSCQGKYNKSNHKAQPSKNISDRKLTIKK